MKKLITLSLLAVLFSLASFAQCPISGTLSTCVGHTTYLSVDSMTCAGGTWTSSAPSIATVAAFGTSGDVTGVSAGVVTISYTVGGATTTASVSVGAAAAAITGTTSFCVGTSTTLADATPGGVWSASPTYIATVNPATGVVAGISGGSANIYYSVPGGCEVYTTVTVESSTMYDSLSGPSSVCSGSTILITAMVSGGTWSSSNPAIATVDPASGLVTGVSTGSVNISYTLSGSCGVAVDYMTVVVNPTTSAGAISGSTTVVVGSTIPQYDYIASGLGSWVSTNPSIATITSGGVLTGVAAGTVIIEYIVYGCSTVDTAYQTITVTALDGVAGTVYFDTTFYGNVKVWLITFNTGTLDLEAVDSTTVYCSGFSVPYSFTGAVSDSYRVKAAIYDTMGMIGSTGFVPTYHDSSYHWNTASVFYHAAGSSDINKNVYMRTGLTTSGPGFISGNVMAGADKGTSGDVPAVNLLVYVYDATTGRQIQTTLTDASGNYSFSNLPVGATYYVYPEAINFATTTYAGINLTSGVPSMTAGNFKKHNVSKTIVPIPTGVNSILASMSSISLFPNPSEGMVQIAWTETANETATVSVLDITGREVYHTSMNFTAGTGTKTLDLSTLRNGNYVVSIKSALISYTNTLTLSGK